MTYIFENDFVLVECIEKIEVITLYLSMWIFIWNHSINNTDSWFALQIKRRSHFMSSEELLLFRMENANWLPSLTFCTKTVVNLVSRCSLIRIRSFNNMMRIIYKVQIVMRLMCQHFPQQSMSIRCILKSNNIYL